MKKNRMNNNIDERTGLIVYKEPRKKTKKTAVFCGTILASLACAAIIGISATQQPQTICDPSQSPEASLGGGANLPSDNADSFDYIPSQQLVCDPSQDPGMNGYAPRGGGKNLPTDGPGDFQAARPVVYDYPLNNMNVDCYGYPSFYDYLSANIMDLDFYDYLSLVTNGSTDDPASHPTWAVQDNGIWRRIDNDHVIRGGVDEPPIIN